MKILRGGFLAVAFLALAGCAGVQPAPSAGFSKERLDALSARMQADTQKGQIPGIVLLVARHGRTAYFEAFGVQDAKTRAPMQKDSIFRIYSMSKPITGVAMMLLFEEGKW